MHPQDTSLDLRAVLDRFGVKKLHPTVETWIREGTPSTGPLRWPSPSEVLAAATPCRTFAANAPDGPFGAALLTEIEGVPLYLALDSGAILSLHHDATLYEVAAELPPARDAAAFTKALVRAGSAFDLSALRSLAARVADWPCWRPEISEAVRVRTLAEGLGLTPAALARLCEKKRDSTEFCALDADALAAFTAAEGKLARLAQGKPRVDLSDAHLTAWPDALDGHPVEQLDLSGNPELPWAELPPRLAALPKLRTLRVGRNGLDLPGLAAALPRIKVRGDNAGAPVLSQDGTHLSLSGANLKKLPAIVDSLSSLEHIDLSGNPGLDWDDACTRLARLPCLAEVSFHQCELQSPPPLHRIPQLRRLSVAGGMGPDANRFATHALFGLLEQLPALEQATLGRVDFGFWKGAFPALPALETLSLAVGGMVVDGAAVMAWIAGLPSLRRLTLTGEASLPLEALAARPELIELRVTGPVTRHLPKLLDSLPNLEVLAFAWHTLDSDTLPAALRRMPLHTLELRWGESGTYTKLPAATLPEWFAELPLTRLSLWFEREFALAPVATAIAGLRGLRSLELTARVEEALPLEIAHLPLVELEVIAKNVPAIVLPESMEKLRYPRTPLNLGALVHLREAHLAEPLTAEQVAQVAQLTTLELLEARWPGESTLPTLPHLRELRGTGGLSDQPALEVAHLSPPTVLPARLRALRELTWTASDRPLIEAALASIAGYRALRSLVFHNAWPKDRTLPEGFARLTQLDRLRLVNTAYGEARAQLKEWLPDCEIVT